MKTQHFGLYAVLTLAVMVAVAVQNISAQEYTSVMEVLQNEELRQDFTIQGEYLDANAKVGLHIIADGGGKFRTVAYAGGLPGDGWKREQARLLGTAELNGEEITFKMTNAKGTGSGLPEKIEAKGKITRAQRPQGAGQGSGPQGAGAGFRGGQVTITLDNPALTFTKQNRSFANPRLNARAPEGAVILFDGTNLDNFPGAKMNEVAIPTRPGQAQGEGQRARRNMNTLWAEAATRPFEKKPYRLHLEFMLSYMPQAKGQGRSNSGVYIDERYECQVLDSFGLEGENNECGGFYTIAKPIVNMCFPPLTWQTYDIDFTPAKYDGDKKVENAKITILHNGVLIHDNVELEKHTPGRKEEGAAPLGVYLQGHGNKVQYRNIWLQYK